MTKGHELSHLGYAITVADNKAEYDESVKELLADKQVLAWILKWTATEFSELHVDEIVPLIEDPLISRVPVEPGMSNDALIGTAVESKIRKEGVIYYDVRFAVASPESDGRRGVHIIVDVEAQKDPNPGYDLVTRGFLYAGRMLSEQMGKTITGKNYDGLEKVYSIWIVFNCNRKIANTTTRYGIKKEAVHGVCNINARYDLAQVVMIYIPKEGDMEKTDNRPSALHSMLYDLFVKKEDPDVKIKNMANTYGLRTIDAQRRINKMCNLSESLLDEGIEKGRAQERVNTERERNRADREQQRADAILREFEEYKRLHPSD